jgi:hypothetical protein
MTDFVTHADEFSNGRKFRRPVNIYNDYYAVLTNEAGTALLNEDGRPLIAG